MNINQLLKKLKENLGLTKYLKLSYTDKDLYDIIVTHALRDWSYYFKYEYDPNTIDITDLELVEPDLVTIPRYITDAVERSNLQIEDIQRIRIGNNSALANSIYSMYNGAFPSAQSMDQLLRGQQLSNFVGDRDAYNNVRYSCWFEKPNMFRFNYPLTMNHQKVLVPSLFRDIRASFYLTQAPNMIGISPTREPYFFKLCRLHIMKVLYENEIKYLENINTGNGNINLKVEEWANAGQALEELLKELEKFSTYSQNLTWFTS